MEQNNCFGFCRKCNKVHSLPIGNSLIYARELQQQLTDAGCLDFTANERDGRFSTDYLFSDARGQMFGVLECLDRDGNRVVLKAFSAQYNGCWKLSGWVPPLFDVTLYLTTIAPVDAEIKRLGSLLKNLERGTTEFVALQQERKRLSQTLMKKLHSLYKLHNFAGEMADLDSAFTLEKGIPTGSADCCAPKLLNYAAQYNLKPIGITEFYFGKENRSKTRSHGEIYGACIDKCQPILGFMLCGIS